MTDIFAATNQLKFAEWARNLRIEGEAALKRGDSKEAFECFKYAAQYQREVRSQPPYRLI